MAEIVHLPESSQKKNSLPYVLCQVTEIWGKNNCHRLNGEHKGDIEGGANYFFWIPKGRQTICSHFREKQSNFNFSTPTQSEY